MCDRDHFHRLEDRVDRLEGDDYSSVSATNAVVTAGVATAEETAAFLKQGIDN